MVVLSAATKHHEASTLRFDDHATPQHNFISRTLCKFVSKARLATNQLDCVLLLLPH